MQSGRRVAEVQDTAAKFVKTDTTTSGDWKGKYGAQGAMVAGDQIFIDLDFTDGKEHQFAMQVGCNRAMSVTVFDADTKVVLETQAIPENAGFRYMAWSIKGNVTIHALNLGSAEASPICIGGLFFNPAGAAAN